MYEALLSEVLDDDWEPEQGSEKGQHAAVAAGRGSMQLWQQEGAACSCGSCHAACDMMA